jgi:PAS domain S-box-containing protein
MNCSEGGTGISFPAQIVEDAPDIIGACDAQGRIIFLNRAGRAWCGLSDSLDGDLALDCAQLYAPAAVRVIKETALPAAARDGVWRGESVLHDREGRECPVEQVIFSRRDATGAVIGFSTIIRDVSAWRLTGQALRESEERFSKAFYHSPDPYVIAEYEKGGIVDVNDSFVRVFGWSRTEAWGKRASELGMWADLAERDRFLEIFRRDGEVHEMEQHRRTKAGKIILCQVTAFRVNIGGRPHTLYRLHDISAERATELAVRESEEKFSKAFQASPDSVAIATTEEEGRLLDVNDGFTRLHGWTREEAVGRTVIELGLWDDPAVRQDIIAELRAGQAVRNRAVVFRDRHGGRHQCLYSGELTEIAGRHCLITIIRDVTEQQRLEEQLRHAQKMESIGQLAGGVAHDFNNILTVIKGHTALLLDEGHLPPDTIEALRQIAQSAEFAANLTRQLLMFSRKQLLQPGPIDLNEVVARTSRLLGRVIGENITLEVAAAPGLPEINADAGMLEQVLLNLVVNARDAMPRGGRVTIATLALLADGDYVRRVPQARLGRFVGLRVSDAGEGISPEILPRIFDPFFTTKQEGKGTGLGLATAYGIVEQHAGWIEVESQLGQGTQFTAWFPALAAPAVRAARVSTPPFGARGGETVLVVEDKEAVRTIVQTVLVRFGYRVVVAETGEEALARWEEHRDQVGLLFTDVVMPGRLTGKELADRLRSARPELKVVFCSGYDAEILDPAALKMPGTRFLAKPFDVSNLARVVRELLDGG